MVEKVVRPPNPKVEAAKRAGNTALLSELGQRGARVRALRKIEAARKKQNAMNDLFVDEILEEERARQLYADAVAHSEDNRIGWCVEED